MASIEQCPDRSEARTLRSDINKCPSLDNYHCLKTEDGQLRELCTSPIWIEAGKCPIYSVTGKLDAKICHATPSRNCPTKVYKSNTNFNYSGCLPSLRREPPTTKPNKESYTTQQPNTTLLDSNDKGVDIVAVGIVVPLLVVVLILIILSLWKKKEIWKYIRNLARNIPCIESESDGMKTQDSLEMGKNRVFEESEDKRLLNEVDSTLEIQPDHFGSENKKKSGPDVSKNETLKQIEPFLMKMAHSVLKTDVFLMIYTQNSDMAEDISMKIINRVCGITEGANIRIIESFSDLKNIEEGKLTMLVLNDVLKNEEWFTESKMSKHFGMLQASMKNGSNGIHALICLLSTTYVVLETLLKNSSLRFVAYDSSTMHEFVKIKEKR